MSFKSILLKYTFFFFAESNGETWCIKMSALKVLSFFLNHVTTFAFKNHVWSHVFPSSGSRHGPKIFTTYISISQNHTNSTCKSIFCQQPPCVYYNDNKNGTEYVDGAFGYLIMVIQTLVEIEALLRCQLQTARIPNGNQSKRGTKYVNMG